MAGRKNRLAQLASLGEDVLDLAAKSPAASRVRRGAVQLKDRVDDLQKQVRGLQQLEDSLEKLERRVEKLERSAKRAQERVAGGAQAARPEGPAAAYAVALGTRTRRAPGTTSKTAGVVPTCSPSTSIGRRSPASTATRAVRTTSTFGCLTWRPL